MNNGIHKWRFARWFSFSKRCFFFPFLSSNCEFLQALSPNHQSQPPTSDSVVPGNSTKLVWSLSRGVSLFPSPRHFFGNPFLTVFSMKLLVETVVRLPFCRNGSPLFSTLHWVTNTRNALENGWFFKMIHFLQLGHFGALCLVLGNVSSDDTTDHQPF